MARNTKAMLLLAGICIGSAASANSPDLSTLAKVGTVDERFQAFNVEMVEVTGGRFWAPYDGQPGEVYRNRPPINLSDPKLIALARNLGPSLMRVSGTWANNTYLPREGEKVVDAPDGFKQVLTRDQWRSVIAFSRAVDAPIVTSFAASLGTRDKDGKWTTAQAQRLVELTKASGGSLYAAEFFNEPNAASAAMAMPKDYTAADYAKDFKIFHAWAGKTVPGMRIIGPGGVGEGGLLKSIPVNVGLGKHIPSADMLAGNPNALDAVSYHFYGSVSQRCVGMGIGTAQKADALKAAWLDATLQDYDFYANLRDRYEPGKPLWNTETAQAACGGSPWAATFLDTFRYLNQLGVLARKGVQVVMHNTLAASDYALLDGDTLKPRPNYWAAVLWKRVMGSTVLAAPVTSDKNLRLYAHCLPDRKGGVGLVALNVGESSQSVTIDGKATSWTLTGRPIDTQNVMINGALPSVNDDGELIGLEGAAVDSMLSIPGQSVAFIAARGANNLACY